MSKRKSSQTVSSSEKLKKISILLVGLLFVGSTLAYGVFLGGRNAGYSEEQIHEHADFAIFVNGALLDLDDEMYYEGGPANYHLMDLHTGYPNTIHMHPRRLSIDNFLRSVGVLLTDECITIGDTDYCNDDSHSLKFLVNGMPNRNFENYAFNDLDSILISYGPVDEDISYQLDFINSIDGAELASAGKIPG